MTSGLSFGSSAPQTNTGLSFGGLSTGQTTGISFGTPATSAPGTGLFGTTSTQLPALSYVQPTNQLSFGGVAAGAGQGSMTFGQQSSTSTLPGGLSFGATPAPTTGVSFGATTFSSAAPSGLTFGAPTATVAPLGSGFGAPATSASTGFSFGATTVPTLGTAQPTLTGLGFGAPGTPAASGSLTFGTPAPTTTTGLSFGATPTSTTFGLQGLSSTTPAAKPLTLSFGSTPATTTGLSLSLTPGTTQGTGFGSLTSGTTQGTGFGTLASGTTQGTGFGSLASGTTQGTGFGSLASGTTQGTGFGLGSASTSTGLFGSKTLTFPSSGATTLSSGGLALPTATPTLSQGLGGVDTTQIKAGQTGLGTGRTDKAVKENQIPTEIVQTIDGFKSFVKAQKALSSDIARCSIKPLDKVREDTEALKQMLASIVNGLQKNRAQADHLKAEATRDVRHAEMAQRTHETPPGLQYDNTAPMQYFAELVVTFEQHMQDFRQEIEKTERHIRSLLEPKPLTPQELSLAMRRLHDSFVALAGRLQTVHNQVVVQKEQYLNLRRYFLKDSSNVFEATTKSIGITERPLLESRIALGPTPFSPMGCQQGYGLLQSMTQESKSSFPSGNPIGK